MRAVLIGIGLLALFSVLWLTRSNDNDAVGDAEMEKAGSPNDSSAGTSPSEAPSTQRWVPKPSTPAETNVEKEEKTWQVALQELADDARSQGAWTSYHDEIAHKIAEALPPDQQAALETKRSGIIKEFNERRR